MNELLSKGKKREGLSGSFFSLEFFRKRYEAVAVIVFVLVILLAHILATDDYSLVRNTISDLGSQGYSRKILMQIGFFLFGTILSVGVFLNTISAKTLLIAIYGICIVLTGIFCAAPFGSAAPYSVFESQAHSLFAQIAGISFTLAILYSIFEANNKKEKRAHIMFFTAIVALSGLFGIFDEYQGLFQRMLYLASFLWLVKFSRPTVDT